MGEKSDQIEREIQLERGQLGRNIDELQTKVQDATDWRVQFQKRPALMMGLAVGGGLLLASVTGRRRSKRYYPVTSGTAEYEHRRGTEIQRNTALETFDSIKGAMIGVAANKFKDWLGEAIPGFREQFQTTAEEKRSVRTSGTPQTASTAVGAS